MFFEYSLYFIESERVILFYVLIYEFLGFNLVIRINILEN